MNPNQQTYKLTLNFSNKAVTVYPGCQEETEFQQLFFAFSQIQQFPECLLGVLAEQQEESSNFLDFHQDALLRLMSIYTRQREAVEYFRCLPFGQFIEIIELEYFLFMPHPQLASEALFGLVCSREIPIDITKIQNTRIQSELQQRLRLETGNNKVISNICLDIAENKHGGFCFTYSPTIHPHLRVRQLPTSVFANTGVFKSEFLCRIRTLIFNSDIDKQICSRILDCEQSMKNLESLESVFVNQNSYFADRKSDVLSKFLAKLKISHVTTHNCLCQLTPYPELKILTISGTNQGWNENIPVWDKIFSSFKNPNISAMTFEFSQIPPNYIFQWGEHFLSLLTCLSQFPPQIKISAELFLQLDFSSDENQSLSPQDIVNQMHDLMYAIFVENQNNKFKVCRRQQKHQGAGSKLLFDFLQMGKLTLEQKDKLFVVAGFVGPLPWWNFNTNPSFNMRLAEDSDKNVREIRYVFCIPPANDNIDEIKNVQDKIVELRSPRFEDLAALIKEQAEFKNLRKITLDLYSDDCKQKDISVFFQFLNAQTQKHNIKLQKVTLTLHSERAGAAVLWEEPKGCKPVNVKKLCIRNICPPQWFLQLLPAEEYRLQDPESLKVLKSLQNNNIRKINIYKNCKYLQEKYDASCMKIKIIAIDARGIRERKIDKLANAIRYLHDFAGLEEVQFADSDGDKVVELKIKQLRNELANVKIFI